MLSHTAMKSFVILTYLVILGSCDRRISNDEKSLDKLLYRSYINNIFRRNAAINEHQINFQTRRFVRSVNPYLQKFLKLFPLKMKAGSIPKELMLGDTPKEWNPGFIGGVVKNMVNSQLPTILRGIPSLGIPSLTPLEVEEPTDFSLDGNLLLGLTITMKRFKLHGLEYFNLTNIEADILSGISSTVEFVVPLIIIDVDYAVTPYTLFFSLPTLPEVHVKIVVTDFKVLAAVKISKVGEAGMMFMEGLDTIVDIEDVWVEFAEWLPGNLMGQIINEIKNLIFSFGAKIVTSYYSDEIGNEIINFINEYVQHISMDMIIKNIMG